MIDRLCSVSRFCCCTGELEQPPINHYPNSSFVSLHVNDRTSGAFLWSRSLTRSIDFLSSRYLTSFHYGRSRSGWSACTPQIDLKFIFWVHFGAIQNKKNRYRAGSPGKYTHGWADRGAKIGKGESLRVQVNARMDPLWSPEVPPSSAELFLVKQVFQLCIFDG